MKCDSIEVSYCSRINLTLASMLQRETLSDKTWCRGTKATFKNLEIPGGAPKYPLERKFQGGGGEGHRKNLPGGYGHFLEL